MNFNECKEKYPIGQTRVRYYTYNKDKIADGTFPLSHADHSIFVCHFGDQDETIVALYDTVIGYVTLDGEFFRPHYSIGWNLRNSMEPDKACAWTDDSPEDADDIRELETEYILDIANLRNEANRITEDIAKRALLENEDVIGVYDGYNWLTKEEMAEKIHHYIHPDVFEIKDDDLCEAFDIIQ